jgi:hypothetical protein
MRKRLVLLLVMSVVAAQVTGSSPPAAAAEAAPDEVGLFDPASGRWHLRYPDGRLSSFYFGIPSDIPLLGDWDCDGVDTVALYRGSSGFIYLRNDNDFGIGEQDFFYGIPGDVPIAGDWDGDGCDTLGILRGDRFFLSNTLDTSVADIDFFLGAPGDQPFAGDFNGDGRDTVGVYRASTHWAYFLNDLSGLPSSGGVAIADAALWVAGSDATVMAGDWDGDGDDTPGVFRSGSSTFRLENTPGQLTPDVTYSFGESNWLPVAGNLGQPGPLPELALATVAEGFARPLLVTAPAGDDRLFVVEQGGRVLIVEDGEVLPTPFLNLSTLVSGGGEQGLLGMAFHPGYNSNRLFYVHYTNTAGDTRVVEYQDGPGGPRAVGTVLAVDQPASNHNGGMLQFGPDGRLYVALGDGGGGGDTYGNGQNAFTPLGAIVAVDVDGTRPDHVWAIGLRNPWRFDWDGDLIYIGDVGQGAWEEVNVVSRFTRLRNFGWNVQEGFVCYPIGTSGCDTSPYIQPLVAYPNPTEGCSITGGYVYRGWGIDGLHGTYLYSDFCGKFLRGLFYDGSDIVMSREWDVGITGTVSSFGEDGFGELYVTTFDGKVSKVVAAG